MNKSLENIKTHLKETRKRQDACIAWLEKNPDFAGIVNKYFIYRDEPEIIISSPYCFKGHAIVTAKHIL